MRKRSTKPTLRTRRLEMWRHLDKIRRGALGVARLRGVLLGYDRIFGVVAFPLDNIPPDVLLEETLERQLFGLKEAMLRKLARS